MLSDMHTSPRAQHGTCASEVLGQQGKLSYFVRFSSTGPPLLASRQQSLRVIAAHDQLPQESHALGKMYIRGHELVISKARSRRSCALCFGFVPVRGQSNSISAEAE